MVLSCCWFVVIGWAGSGVDAGAVPVLVSGAPDTGVGLLACAGEAERAAAGPSGLSGMTTIFLRP